MVIASRYARRWPGGSETRGTSVYRAGVAIVIASHFTCFSFVSRRPTASHLACRATLDCPEATLNRKRRLASAETLLDAGVQFFETMKESLFIFL